MQNIGERLEEARKRQGISIREAAEATKIRGDFLHAFESNSMDVPLPDVYIRGFLINYAKFLKLDPDKVVTDYNALKLSQETTQSKGVHDFLGRMDLRDTDPTRETPDAGKQERSAKESIFGADRTLYYKVALISGSAFLVIFLIVILVSLFVSLETPQINPELQASPAISGAPVTPVAEEKITLIALDDVIVSVRQVIDGQQLFSGMLAKDDTETLNKIGPVRISYIEGENLNVEKDGQRYKMGTKGAGTSTIE